MRAVVVALGFVLAAGAASATEDPVYLRANARLARATPHYPRARLLVEEETGGEVGPVPFEAVQRVYRLSRPATQRTVLRFYARRLGEHWRQRGATCLVSRSRIVVAVVYPKRRRLGVLIDSRGAPRCQGLAWIIGQLLELGYPDG
jgi:hypothetical protein